MRLSLDEYIFVYLYIYTRLHLYQGKARDARLPTDDKPESVRFNIQSIWHFSLQYYLK